MKFLDTIYVTVVSIILTGMAMLAFEVLTM